MSEVDILKTMELEAEEKLIDMQKALELQGKYHLDLQRRRQDAERKGHTTVRTVVPLPTPRINGQLPPAGVPEKIAKILRESGKDMKAKDITKVLVDGGETCGGKKGLGPNVLSALRRRDDLFENVSRGVYRLKKKE